MPQFDPTTFLPQVFWLCLIFGVLYTILWRVIVPRMTEILHARSARLRALLDRVKEVTDHGERVALEVDAELAAASSAAREAFQARVREMRVEQERLRRAAEADLQVKIAAAEAEMAVRAVELMQTRSTRAVAAAQQMYEKLVGTPVNAAALQQALQDVPGEADAER